MMTPLRRKAVLLMLAVPLAGGGALIAYENWNSPRRSATPDASASVPPVRAAEREAFRLPPLSSFRNITSRPLFTATRRPAPASTGTASRPNDRGPDPFLLTGVIIADEARLAIIQDQRGAAQYQVGIGGQINGWTVEAIHPDRVIVARGGERAEIVLEASTRRASRRRTQNRRR